MNNQQIFKDALQLPTIDRASLANDLLSSLDQPDEHIDALWRDEVEDRIRAFQDGKMQAISLKEVLAKYNR